MPRAIQEITTRPTRRDTLTAIGTTMLAGIAVAGFARPDQPGGSDAALLAACAEFDRAQAHVDYTERSDVPDEVVDQASENWYSVINDVLAAPRPVTNAGRLALARVARTAWMGQVADLIDVPFAELATREEQLVLATLDSIVGA